MGNAVPRVEDPDLVQGKGDYVDDLVVDGALHLAFVRSPFAHARIHVADVEAARAAPGVVGVFTAADLDLPAGYLFFEVNPGCARPQLATERVRFVGEPVAVVVAETRSQAVDAVELVALDYDPLPAVVDMEEALAPGAPLQFDGVPGNVVGGERDPDDVVVRVRIENPRLAVAPMEGNAVLVIPGEDADDVEVTAYVSTQMPHGARAAIARTFQLDKKRVRVIAPFVGGAFGGKAGLPVEHTVAVAVARRLGRHFAQSRLQAFDVRANLILAGLPEEAC